MKGYFNLMSHNMQLKKGVLQNFHFETLPFFMSSGKNSFLSPHYFPQLLVFFSFLAFAFAFTFASAFAVFLAISTFE